MLSLIWIIFAGAVTSALVVWGASAQIISTALIVLVAVFLLLLLLAD